MIMASSGSELVPLRCTIGGENLGNPIKAAYVCPMCRHLLCLDCVAKELGIVFGSPDLGWDFVSQGGIAVRDFAVCTECINNPKNKPQLELVNGSSQSYVLADRNMKYRCIAKSCKWSGYPEQHEGHQATCPEVRMESASAARGASADSGYSTNSRSTSSQNPS